MGAFRMVEIVATVDAREAPVKPCLVFVMTRTVFGEDSVSVGRDNRMEIGAEFRPGILSQDRLVATDPEDGDRACRLVLPQQQRSRVGGCKGDETASHYDACELVCRVIHGLQAEGEGLRFMALR